MRGIQWATLVSVALAGTDSPSLLRSEASANSSTYSNSSTSSSKASSEDIGGTILNGLGTTSLPAAILPSAGSETSTAAAGSLPSPSVTTSSAARFGNFSLSSRTAILPPSETSTAAAGSLPSPSVTTSSAAPFGNFSLSSPTGTEKPACTAGSRCEIAGDQVQFFYFPPAANVSLSRDTAQEPTNFVTTQPPTTWTPITTGPYTVLPGNTTWYSGNVYVSLRRVSAQCVWSGVGGNQDGKVLTMAPSELFPQLATIAADGRKRRGVDFDPGAYNRWLAVSDAIRRLDDNWKTCDLPFQGIHGIRVMPPIALSSVGDIFVTLTPIEPIPQPTPGQQPAQSQVKPTAVHSRPSFLLLPPHVVPGQGLSPGDAPLNNPGQGNQGQGNPGQSNPAQPGSNPQPTPSPTATTIGTIGGQPIVVIPQPTNPPAGGNPGTPANPPGRNPANPPGGAPGNGNGSPAQQQPPPVVIIGTQTLRPGSSITIPGGTTIVLPPGNNDPGNGNSNGNPSPPTQIIVRPPNNAAPSTITIPAGAVQPPPPPPAPTTIGVIGGSPVVLNPANPSHIHVDGPNGGDLWLAPGAPGFVVGGGTSISMPNPSEIWISAPGQAAPSTLYIPPVLPAGATPTQGVVVTVLGGGQMTATAVWGPQGSSLVVDGTMMVPGGAAVTLGNGVVVSQAPQAPGQQGGLVVVNPKSGTTSTLAISSVAGLGQVEASPTPEPTGHAVLGAVITIGGKTYTVLDRGSSLVIPELGVTLTESGSASVVAGTVLSDAGTGVVVAGSTQAFSTISLGGNGTIAGNGDKGGVTGGGNGNGGKGPQPAATSKKGAAARVGGGGLMAWWVGISVGIGALAVGL